MVTKYHRTVEEGLILLGKTWIEQKKVKYVYKGNQSPLSIVDPKSKLVVNYQPDVYFVLKRNDKRLIFEILDSEEKKQDMIIADVIQSFLIEHVEGVLFIYAGSDADELRIMEALITISKGLVHKGISELDIPINKSGPIRITREKAASPERVRDILLKEMKDW